MVSNNKINADNFNLSDFGLLKVSGENAKKFLQGQLTCDLEKLAANESLLAAHCNPQGRVISLFYLFQLQNSYYLFMLRSMIPIAQAALKKYAVFFRAELMDASNELMLFGIPSELANQIPSNLIKIKLPSPASSFIVIDGEKELTTDSNAWITRNIQKGIPTIYPETSGKFLPHELNLPQLNGVDFDKGCYTGQEIIARMHYRGKLKKHLYIASITAKSQPLPGTNIYSYQDEEAKESGIVVDSSYEEYNKLVTPTEPYAMGESKGGEPRFSPFGASANLVCAQHQNSKAFPRSSAGTADNKYYKTLILIDETNAINNTLFLKDDLQVFFILEEQERKK